MTLPPLDMKNPLFKILFTLALVAIFKSALISYCLLSKDKVVDTKSTHVAAKEEKKNVSPSSVFSIPTAQAAEQKDASIPKPDDKLIAKQWEKLKAKEAELKRKEQELKEIEQRIDKKLAEQKELIAKLENLIKQAQVLQDKKIRHLVEVYSNMDAARAADVLEKLDKDLAVKILAGMKGRTAGQILTNMNSKIAADLSEALTEFQTPFSKK